MSGLRGVEVPGSPPPDGTQSEIVVDRVGPIGFIDLSGELDLRSNPGIAEAVGGLLGSDPIKCLMGRAGRVDYVDSTGFSSFLSARSSLRFPGIDFQLESVSPALPRVAGAAKITDLLAQG